MNLDKTHAFATVAGFATAMVANTLLALVVLAPINDDLGIARTKEQGLNFPALIAGYLVLALVTVWLVPLVHHHNWAKRGAVAGAALGIGVFVAGHLIVTGWSVANLAPMAFSGLIDTLAAIAGALAVSRLLPPPTYQTETQSEMKA